MCLRGPAAHSAGACKDVHSIHMLTGCHNVSPVLVLTSHSTWHVFSTWCTCDERNCVSTCEIVSLHATREVAMHAGPNLVGFHGAGVWHLRLVTNKRLRHPSRRGLSRVPGGTQPRICRWGHSCCGAHRQAFGELPAIDSITSCFKLCMDR